MRLYCHLVGRPQTILDQEGVEVADLDDACDDVVRALEALCEEDPSASQERAGWTMNVTDGAGTVLLTLDLDSDITARLRVASALALSLTPPVDLFATSELGRLRLSRLRRSTEPD